MKNTAFTKKLILAFLASFSMLSFWSCSKKASFLNSSIVPAARGTVKVKLDNNKNYAISISLNNLAEPERLTPSKVAYVVWMMDEKGEVKNLGQIKTSIGVFSKVLKASFETVSLTKPTKILITAENDITVQYVDKDIILTTETL